jgi:presenilin-like A22 family membrane protease
MKNNLKITAIVLGLFLLTQFLGLYVVNHYVNQENELPFGLETPEIEKQSDYRDFFYAVIVAFVIAIALLFLLTKIKAEFILRAWFFIVITIALGITINSFIPTSVKFATWIALAIALPLTFFKVFKKNFLIHNLTEFLIYPGIAAIFVPILNLWTILIFLVLLSGYDMWAVWHSGIMQKMAKFQMNKVKIFGGLMIPYLDKKTRKKIKEMKKSKSKKKKALKINMAILGGGDLCWPLIAAGVVFKTNAINLPFGLPEFIGGLGPAIFVIFGALLGLTYLLIFSEKKKFYPAMPFITTGILIGMIASYFIF